MVLPLLQATQTRNKNNPNLQSPQNPHPPSKKIQKQRLIPPLKKRYQCILPIIIGHETLRTRSITHLLIPIHRQREERLCSPQVQRGVQYLMQLKSSV